MFKDIVVPLIGTSADAYALNLGLDLAASQEGRLTVLEIVSLPLPAAAPWGIVPEIGMGELYGKLRTQGQANATKTRERLSSEPVDCDVEILEAQFVEPDRAIAKRARLADLTVIGNTLGDSAEADRSHAVISSLLLESGRPVLVVPVRCKVPMPPRRIVVAWKPTANAARAVHDALPLLRQADAVDVVLIDPREEAATGQAHGAEIVAHLARHGIHAGAVVLDSGSRAASTVLLDHAQQSHAQLLVAGGYGHSRLRQWALGGMTRELLFSSNLPVLFSH